MPGMSGLEALWQARSQGIDTSVTLMSGSENSGFMQVARELNAFDFLFKPFSAADIRAVVRSFLRRVQPLRALVVDDSQTVRRLIRKILEQSQFSFVAEEASAGPRAISKALSEYYDIVFLDYLMPGLNGIETLQRLLEQQPQLRVAMMSSDINPEREQEALQIGAAAILHKPFYPTDVDALLNDVFDLRGPQVLTVGTDMTSHFDVAICGSRIAVIHNLSGHVFEYQWYRAAPHLRNCRLRDNSDAAVSAHALRGEAERIAISELQRSHLLGAA
jgi:CheY-like chemotaxis protein